MSPDKEAQLREIPIAYQDTVNLFVDRQIADGDCPTDSAMLTLLRTLQRDFENGYYITPDGEMALLEIDNPDALYANGGVDLLTSGEDGESNAAASRQTILKGVGLGVILLVMLGLLLSSRNRRLELAEVDATGEPAPATAQAANSAIPTAAPLQAIENQEEALQTIGGLGGALTLGRPASLEIHYQETEDVVAFPIDPALVAPQGELPFDPERMASENPVAVWVLGTVLNYNIGIPDLFARNIQPGDALLINTDTGSSLRFVVTETFEGNTYDPTRHLNQDRIGATLFSLPAPADNRVRFISASYDIATEDSAVTPPLSQNDPILFANGQQVEIARITYGHTSSGEVQFEIEGTAAPETHFLLALSSLAAQTETTTPVRAGERWSASFLVPDRFMGGPLLAELRAVPSNELLFVELGHFPLLTEQLQVHAQTAYWFPETQTGVVHLTVTNDGGQPVRVGETYINLTGGEQTQKREIPLMTNLPLLLAGNETQEITLSFVYRTSGEPLVLQAGSSLYELQLTTTYP